MARGWLDKLKRRHLAKIRQTLWLEALSVIALDFANSGFLSHLRVTGQFTTLSIADRLRGNQRTVDVAVLALQRLLRRLGLHLVLLRVNPKVPPPA
jgi:hypothetical protein